MLSYREFLLHSVGIAQDCIFEQALRWMDAFETYQVAKPKLRPRKKRANRLSKTLKELQQPVAAHRQQWAYAKLQPLFRNPAMEAAPPDEADCQSSGPLYASYRDTACDLSAIAHSIYLGWKKYRLNNASATNAVYFSPTSPRNTSDDLHHGRAEFETQAIQLTEIYTRMLCSEDPRQRTQAETFTRPSTRVDYSKVLLDQLEPRHFSHDALYLREGKPVAIFLPCAYWWDGEQALERFITWLIRQCATQELDFELWQPGLVPEFRSASLSPSPSRSANS